jgi:hypothetical protein
MKKALLLVGGLLLLNVFLSAGYSSPKSDQTGFNPYDYSNSEKDQFLSAPKTAPVLLPLPNQSKDSKPSSGGSPQSSAEVSKPSKNSSASNTGTTEPAPALQQATNPQSCVADETITCTAPSTTTTPPADTGSSCNLSDPNTPIEQYQETGHISC